VWNTIQALQKNGTARLKIPVKIVASSKDTIQAAVSEDNQNHNKIDMLVTLKAPMASPPPAGAAIDIVGSIVDYVPSPFMFIMRDGEVAAGK
jgi:hypothetical protein